MPGEQFATVRALRIKAMKLQGLEIEMSHCQSSNCWSAFKARAPLFGEGEMRSSGRPVDEQNGDNGLGKNFGFRPFFSVDRGCVAMLPNHRERCGI